MSNNKTIIPVNRNPNRRTKSYEYSIEEAEIETYCLYQPTDLSFFSNELKGYQQLNSVILSTLAQYKPNLNVTLMSYEIDECSDRLILSEKSGELKDLTIVHNSKQFIKFAENISEFQYIQILAVGKYSTNRSAEAAKRYLITKEGLVPQV